MTNLKDELWQTSVGVDPFVAHIQKSGTHIEDEISWEYCGTPCVYGQFCKMNKSCHCEGDGHLF